MIVIDCFLPKPMQRFIISKVPAESLPKASTDAYPHCAAKTSNTAAIANLQCNPYQEESARPQEKSNGEQGTTDRAIWLSQGKRGALTVWERKQHLSGETGRDCSDLQ